MSDGSFADHSNWPECRDPVDCNDPIPTPDSTSKLQPSTSSDLKEFDAAIFDCQDSTLALPNGESKFALTCGLNGVFPLMDSWPKCKPTSCAEIPVVEGFTSQNTAPVSIGDTVQYKCSTDGLVTDMGKTVTVSCTEDGTITFPESVTCREPIGQVSHQYLVLQQAAMWSSFKS